MLVAINNKGERVTANKYLSKEEKYYCPGCKEELIFRNGIKQIPHFAHKPKSSCNWLGGESLTHEKMKLAMKDIIERDNDVTLSELEWRIKDKTDDYVIADYYFEKRDKWNNIKCCAVECVHKHQDLKHFLEKNEFYFENKIYPIWVFDLNRFQRGEIRINSILKESHAINFGKVWAVDSEHKSMFAVHFESVERWVESWEEFGGYYKTLRATKSVMLLNIQQFNIISFQYKKRDKFIPYDRLVASPFLKPFWK